MDLACEGEHSSGARGPCPRPDRGSVSVETDAGVIGYGEAGLPRLERVLLGEDPLEIEKLFWEMTGL